MQIGAVRRATTGICVTTADAVAIALAEQNPIGFTLAGHAEAAVAYERSGN